MKCTCYHIDCERCHRRVIMALWRHGAHIKGYKAEGGDRKSQSYRDRMRAARPQISDEELERRLVEKFNQWEMEKMSGTDNRNRANGR